MLKDLSSTSDSGSWVKRLSAVPAIAERLLSTGSYINYKYPSRIPRPRPISNDLPGPGPRATLSWGSPGSLSESSESLALHSFPRASTRCLRRPGWRLPLSELGRDSPALPCVWQEGTLGVPRGGPRHKPPPPPGTVGNPWEQACLHQPQDTEGPVRPKAQGVPSLSLPLSSSLCLLPNSPAYPALLHPHRTRPPTLAQFPEKGPTHCPSLSHLWLPHSLPARPAGAPDRKGRVSSSRQVGHGWWLAFPGAGAGAG